MNRQDAKTILDAVRLGCGAHLSESTITAALQATGDIGSGTGSPQWRRPPMPMPIDSGRKWPHYATADGQQRVEVAS